MSCLSYSERNSLFTEPRVTEGDKLRLHKSGYDFMDITDHPDLGKLNAQLSRSSSFAPMPGLSGDAQLLVQVMMDELEVDNIKEDITQLSSFWNRNYKSKNGLKSSNWIYDQVAGVSIGYIDAFITLLTC